MSRQESRNATSWIAAELLGNALQLSGKTQAAYLATLGAFREELREWLKPRIHVVKPDQRTFWRGMAGKRTGFVDGGLASIEELGTQPLAIRAGTYVVTPGDRSSSREEYAFPFFLVADLYDDESADALFADWSEEFSKLRDAARMFVETAAVHSLVHRAEKPLRYVFLQGPLVNPVAPYWGDHGVPAFTTGTLEKFGVSPEDIAAVVGDRKVHELCHFIAVMRYMTDRIFDAVSDVPVAGVIESPSQSLSFTRSILDELVEDGTITESVRKEWWLHCEGYHLTDATIFATVLEEGEWVRPIAVDKNALSKAPREWEGVIGRFRKPWTTYVRSSARTAPQKVECTVPWPSEEWETVIGLIVHMSRLLPRYGFPVGLDIVDKHAKIPDWMTQSVRRQIMTGAMKRALESGDVSQISQMRDLLLSRKRHFFNRPKAQ